MPAGLEYNSFDEQTFGDTMWDLAKTSVFLMASDPIARMGGSEYGMFPGARRFRQSAKGKGKMAGTLGFVSRIGIFPNRIEGMSAVGRLRSYGEGLGPIFERPTSKIGQYYFGRVTDTANRWWLGGLADETLGDVSEVYARHAGEIPKKGFLSQIKYWRNVARGNTDAPKGTLALPSGNIPTSTPANPNAGTSLAVAAAHPYDRRINRKIASFEIRSLVGRTVGKYAMAFGYMQTAMWAASVTSGIVRAGHDYGAGRLEAKHTAPAMINTPAGESLRMQAMQNAALSFGAVRSAIGNEAMANHRY